MKPHWILTLSLTLILATACSKDEEAAEEGTDAGEPAAPPAENNGPSQPTEPTNTEPSNPTTNTNSATPTQPQANLPVGKQRAWAYGTGQPTDLDQAFLNRAANVLTNQLGMPVGTQAQGQYGIWFYDQMKVDYMGTNYSRINVIIQQGRVVRLTVDPRSVVLGGGSGGPDAPPSAP